MEKRQAAHKLTVKFHEIPQGGLEFHFSNLSKELDLNLQDLLGPTPTYTVDLKLDQIEPMTQVKGRIQAQLPHICSRCAENFESQISKKFTTLYYKSEDGIKSLAEGFEDLDASFDLEYLPSGELELGDAVYEQLALEVPFQPLCSETCKGLCSQCGANLNLTENADHHHFRDGGKSLPFADSLKELKV